MSTFHAYIYLYTAFLYKHVQIIDQKKYYFTTNHSKQSEIVDGDFNKNIFDWHKTVNKEKPFIKHVYASKNYVINNSDYTWDNVKELISKRTLISALHTDIDTPTRDNIIQQLHLSSTPLLEITHTSLLFLTDSEKITKNQFNNECLTILYNLYVLD